MKKLMRNTLVLMVVALFLSSCTTTQTNCGTKKDHKTRTAKTKRMAPSMMGR